MSNSDNFSSKEIQKKSSIINLKNIVIGVLAAVIVGLTGYLITDKNKLSGVIHQQAAQITKVNDEKSDIQKSFDASLARLDSMHAINTSLDGKLLEKNREIAKVKSAIRSILNKRNASTQELSRAKSLIASLNGKIENLQEEVIRLAKENDNLSSEKALLTMEKERLTTELSSTENAKQALEKKVDIGTTLNASNIKITPVNIKNNGKEKVSTVAKRVDKFMISFDVDNRIAAPGTMDVYVLVIGPDGKPVAVDGQDSGTFNTRMDGYKSFTARVPVEIETAIKKNVEFAFKPETIFQQGDYTVQIYQNGFMIGERTQSLKKGGLFS